MVNDICGLGLRVIGEWLMTLMAMKSNSTI